MLRFYLAATVRRLVDEVTSTDDSVTVEVHGTDAAVAMANAKLFERAVTNLPLNAVAYGGPKITVFVRDFAEESVVDVQASGPAIPELDRPKVIKPFVRLSAKKTRGTGLGLAIVTRIMNLHHGKLHIVDAPTGGHRSSWCGRTQATSRPPLRDSCAGCTWSGAKSRVRAL